jgi:hypothetical protein
LWQYIDAKTTDFLQIMDEWTNFIGLLEQLIQLIPGYELLPFDDVQDWVEAFGQYNREAYDSEKTVELEQEIICELYCIAIDNGCTIDFGDVYDYFVGRIGGLNTPTFLATFAEWSYFMASGDYPNDRIVFLWSAFQLILAFVGQEFLGQHGIERYALYAQAGDPDNEWSILCDACNTILTFDYRLSDQGAHAITGSENLFGVWTDGVGFTLCGYSGRTAWIQQDFPSLMNIDSIRVVINFHDVANTASRSVSAYDSADNKLYNVQLTGSATFLDQTFDNLNLTDVAYIRIIAGNRIGVSNCQNSYIQQLIVSD